MPESPVLLCPYVWWVCCSCIASKAACSVAVECVMRGEKKGWDHPENNQASLSYQMTKMPVCTWQWWHWVCLARGKNITTGSLVKLVMVLAGKIQKGEMDKRQLFSLLPHFCSGWPQTPGLKVIPSETEWYPIIYWSVYHALFVNSHQLISICIAFTPCLLGIMPLGPFMC